MYNVNVIPYRGLIMEKDIAEDEEWVLWLEATGLMEEIWEEFIVQGWIGWEERYFT